MTDTHTHTRESAVYRVLIQGYYFFTVSPFTPGLSWWAHKEEWVPMNHLSFGKAEGYQTVVFAWSRAPGPMFHPPPPTPYGPLAQLLPHVREKNCVLVLQTKDLNFGRQSLAQTVFASFWGDKTAQFQQF